MPLINHTPDDHRASLYGTSCQDKVLDPRGKISQSAGWYGIGGSLPGDNGKRKYSSPNRFKKRIVEIATGRVFESVTEAALELGISHSAMSQKVRRKKGYDYAVKTRRQNLMVRNLITGKVYESVNEASGHTGDSIDTVRNHCQQNLKLNRYEYVEREANVD